MSTYLEKFKNNLRQYSTKDLENIKTEWEYIGGDKNPKQLEYYYYNTNQQHLEKKVLPEHQDKCQCGHDIVEQCYIRNKVNKIILTVGNCCVKKSDIPMKKLCLICKDVNTNRIKMLCNKCYKIKENNERLKIRLSYLDNFTIYFGKHKNKQFKEVFDTEKSYCDYISNQPTNNVIKNFQEYILLKQNFEESNQTQENQE